MAAEPTATIPDEEAGLELTRWSTRFVRDETEASYCEWQVKTGQAMSRLVGLTAIAAGAVAGVVVAHVRPAGSGPWLLAIFGAQIPAVLIT